MATLTIPDEGRRLEGAAAVAYLRARGVWLDRWEASERFAPEAEPDVVLRA
jgi:hypothetical protein